MSIESVNRPSRSRAPITAMCDGLVAGLEHPTDEGRTVSGVSPCVRRATSTVQSLMAAKSTGGTRQVQTHLRKETSRASLQVTAPERVVVTHGYENGKWVLTSVATKCSLVG